MTSFDSPDPRHQGTAEHAAPAATSVSGTGDSLDGLGYGQALAELEQILRQLDRDDVDVDLLGEKVSRASQLLRLCRERIAAARFEVEQVVAGMQEVGGEAGGAAGNEADVAE